MIGHLFNVYSSSKENVFLNKTPSNEAFIVGRLAYSEQVGLFKNITLTTRALPILTDTESEDYKRFFSTGGLSESMDGYVNKKPINRFFNYYSKTAIHGFLYSLGDYIFDPDPESYLQFLIVQKSLCFSFCLVLLSLWFARVYNIYAALLIILSLLFSPIMTYMARALYFVPHTFYINLLVGCYFLHNDLTGKKIFGLKHYVILGILMFYHMLFHSFEYLSTVGLTALLPFFFYGLLSKNDFRVSLKRFITIGFIYAFVFAIGFFGVLLQYKVATGKTLAGGMDHIASRHKLRGGTSQDMQDLIDAASTPQQKKKLENLFAITNMSLLETIELFLDQDGFGIYDKNRVVGGIKYSGYLIIFIISSLILLFSTFKQKWRYDDNVPWVAVLSLIFAFCAPVSWFILFKQHSVQHYQFVVFIWFVPFMFFGLGVTGLAIEALILRLRRPRSANIAA